MEALLSHAFDNLSSKNCDKVRKGIKQIEGLLAQICFSKSSTSQQAGHNRRASVVPAASNGGTTTAKTLKDLPEDPAFREFFRLQEGFEFNVATHLLATLNNLLSHPPGTADSLLTSTLSLLQGILLLHPPSRHLFTSPTAMDTLLDLLDTANPPSVQQSAVLVLVTALLNNPKATRTFEKVDGLLSIKDLLRSEDTTRTVKMSVMEFLYFYLMPEAPLPSSSERNGTAVRVRRGGQSMLGEEEGSSLYANGTGGSFVEGGRGYDGEGVRLDTTIKTSREKQRLLGQYISNVDGLVEDLQESNYFELD